jgi:hypothetical protein
MTDIRDIIGLFGDEGPAPRPSGSAVLAEQFKSDVCDFIISTRKSDAEPDAPPRTYLRASGLYQVCGRREAIYCVEPHLEVHEKITVGQMMTFDVGHSTHAWWQNKYLGPMGRLWGNWFCAKCKAVTSEGLMPKKCPDCNTGRTYWTAWGSEDGVRQAAKVDNITYVETALKCDEFGYTGHPDGMLIDPAIGGAPQMLFELKTISPSGYEGLRKPKDDHVIQMHAYMRLLKMREAMIVYVDKGKQCDWSFGPDGLVSGKPHIKIFHITYNENFWEQIAARITNYYDARGLMSADEPPTLADAAKFPRVCNSPGDFLAKNCPVRDKCFSMRTR